MPARSGPASGLVFLFADGFGRIHRRPSRDLQVGPHGAVMVGPDRAVVAKGLIPGISGTRLVIRRSSRGAIWGAECSRAGLVSASLCWREPVFSLLRRYAAAVGTGWLAMVRRRSTVRFRKGALQVKGYFSNLSAIP
jgi:hypothetical protein